MTAFGFSTFRRGSLLVVRRDDVAREVEDAGLLDPVRLDERIGDSSRGSGRGEVARIELPGCPALAVKKMRRGGVARRVWHDRFPGLSRLRANVDLPIALRRRGIATPPPVFLVALAGPPGLWQGWLATEAVEGASDLAARLASASPVEPTEIRAAVRLVRRLHDAGVDHRDLNLGNLLVRGRDAGRVEAFVVDIDKTRLEPGPLGFRARQRALRRLERSYVKIFGDTGPLGSGARDVWYRLYSEGEPDLERRLRARRSVGNLLLAAHRLSWRAQGKRRA